MDAQELLVDGLLSVTEAGRFLSCSRSYLYDRMDAGELQFVRLGRARRIPRRAVVEFAAARLTGGSQTKD